MARCALDRLPMANRVRTSGARIAISDHMSMQCSSSPPPPSGTVLEGARFGTNSSSSHTTVTTFPRGLRGLHDVFLPADKSILRFIMQLMAMRDAGSRPASRQLAESGRCSFDDLRHRRQSLEHCLPLPPDSSAAIQRAEWCRGSFCRSSSSPAISAIAGHCRPLPSAARQRAEWRRGSCRSSSSPAICAIAGHRLDRRQQDSETACRMVMRCKPSGHRM